MKNTALFVPLVILSMTALPVTTAGATEPVTAEFARKGTVTCRPTLNYFCRNIHIGCSGRSNISTFIFDVTTNNDRASLKERASAESQISPPRRSGPIDWADDYEYAIVWLHPTSDYLKIAADGTYSFRHYSRGTAYMSYGKCR